MAIEVPTKDHPHTFERAGLDHSLRAVTELLRGLKDHPNRRRTVLVREQDLGRAEQHRDVSVVGAGVHQPGLFGGVREPRLFGDRQTVHIGAQRHRRHSIRTRQVRQDARSFYSPMSDPETIQLGFDP